MSKYKIIFIYALEKSTDSYDQEFDDLNIAKEALKAIALYTLKLHDAGVMLDYSNVAIIQEYVYGEW
ncbi:MAG: hypothetical protein IH843_06775 [Thaumarchaeota archaeon]|nr:hypothetical protein [Nitrososphaerota archaeon]